MDVNSEKSWPLTHTDDVTVVHFEWFCGHVAYAFFLILKPTHSFRLMTLPMYQIHPFLSKPKLSLPQNLSYRSINVLMWHSPNVNSNYSQGLERGFGPWIFLLWQGMVRGNLINLILPGEKVCHGNMRTKSVFLETTRKWRVWSHEIHFEARDRKHRKCDKSFGMWWPPSVYIRNRMTFALKVIAQKKAKLKGNGQDALSESGKTLKVCLDRNSKSCEGRTDILEWRHTKDERSRHIN